MILTSDWRHCHCCQRSAGAPALVPPQDRIWTMSQLPFVKLEDGLPRHRERRASR